jgi:hypothetical protein
MNFSSESSIEHDNDECMDILRQLCDDNYFNMAENKFVNLYFLYIVNGTCDQYKKEVVELRGDSLLTREDFMAEIIKYRVNAGRKFNVIGIYSYRPEFTNDELEQFVTLPVNCFFGHSQVETIRFPESIELFQHHNSVFILMSSDQVKKTVKSGTGSSGRKTIKNIN